MNRLLRILALLFLVTAGTASALAQYNPVNPPEPTPGVFKYHLAVSCDPSDVAYTSGEGDYNPGQTVWINTSSYRSNYTFSHWTLDGERYTDEQGFYYTTTDRRVSFVAHYAYAPGNPEEPSILLQRRLHLSSYPVGTCSFSLSSGARYEVGSQYYLAAYPNQGYRFVGWYEGEEQISSNQEMWYTIPDRDVTLVARFVYSPENPLEPEGNQEDVDMPLPGDIDGDDIVDDFDLGYLVKIVLEKADPVEAADVNKNKQINIGDVTKLVEILQQQKQKTTKI